MPSPQEILADPNFNALPLGERLKVMRTVDPVFAGLPPKDQGTVLYQSAAALHPSPTQDQPQDAGFWSTIGHDIMSIPGGLIHAASNPGEALANATQARLALRPKAAQALKEGNLSGAAGYGLASMMPFVGPAAAQAGEELGGGQEGQGAAHATELLAPFAARIPEVRNAVVSDETLGTMGEYLKSKRWMDAKARYQAKTGTPAAPPTPDVPPPPAPPSAASAPSTPAPPSLDEIIAGLTGGSYKKFANAPAKYQQAAVSTQRNLSGVPPTPKPVPTTAAPPVVAPPPDPIAGQTPSPFSFSRGGPQGNLPRKPVVAPPPGVILQEDGMPLMKTGTEPPNTIPRYASSDIKPNAGFPPAEHIPQRYQTLNEQGHIGAAERMAYRKDLRIAEYAMSPESGSVIKTPEDWLNLPLAEQNAIAKAAFIKNGGNVKSFSPFGSNQGRAENAIKGRSEGTGVNHVYQTLRELMVPPPPQ